MFLIIVPVLVPYFLSLGLSMEEIFIVQACFGLAMAVFEVPSAYLGDLWGRKHVMLLGSFITGVASSLLLVAKDFTGLLIYEILLGIGASFVSGAGVSILYDSLKDKPDEQLKAMGNFQTSSLVGESIAGIVCALLILNSYAFVVWGQVIVAWVPFFIALSIIEPKIEKMNKKAHFDNLKEVLSYIFIDNSFIRLIFINMVLWSLSTFYAIWIIQKYWQDQSISLSMIGILWASCNLIAAITTKKTVSLERRFGPRKLLIVMCLLPILAYILMGTVGGVLGVASCSFFYLSRGINTVLMRDAFNSRIKSKFRNTANSMISLFFRFGFFLTGPLIGWLIDKNGIETTLVWIGMFYLICFVFLTLPFIRKVTGNAEA